MADRLAIRLRSAQMTSSRSLAPDVSATMRSCARCFNNDLLDIPDQ